MARWIKLDPDTLNAPTQERVRGVEVTVFVSSYDVPEAIVGDYSEEKKKFVIEFKYVVPDEPWELRDEGDIIGLRVGKLSGRLYGIEIDVDKADANAVNLTMRTTDEVNEALDRLIANSKKKKRLGNYRLAKKAFVDNQRELLKDLAVH